MSNFSTWFSTTAILTLFLAACTHYRAAEPTPDPITESLFDSKDRTISEADIQRILDGRIRLRDTMRLALFQFGAAQNRYWYDEESLHAQQQLVDTFAQAIRQSSRIQRVILLPTLVTGSHPNIQQLRESAVRLQADMLLVYSLRGDIFQKYRVFKKDEAKAFATCEMVLMDVRTGVIPFTHIATRSAQAPESNTDFDLDELRQRVQRTAILDAMLETGRQVADFLNAAQ